MAYSKEQKQAFRQANQLFRHIQNIQRNIDKPSGQIAWAELHFNGNVPKVKSKPRLSDFGLPDNIEEQMEAEKKEKISKIEHVNKIRRIIVLMMILAALMYLFYIEFADSGFSDAIFLTVLMLPAAGFIYLLVGNIFSKSTDNIHVQNEDTYHQYEDELLAYNYWQNIRSVSYWDNLDGHAFERKVADLYKKYGYDAVVSKAGGDGGIDIVLTKGEEKIAVQCKAHNKAVAPAVARDLFGTMTSNGYKKGMIVSKNGFTKGVFEFVKDKDIELVDMDDLIKMVNNL